MQVNFSFSAQRKSLINFPKLRPDGVTLYFSLFIFVIMMFRVFLLRVEKMVLNFLLSMVLNPTMMDDLYYCGVGNRSDGQNVCRSITDFAFDNSLFNIQKREEGFLVCYYPSCSIWFLTISKKDLSYQSSVLTLKMVLDCNNAIRKKENSVAFPAKNALCIWKIVMHFRLMSHLTKLQTKDYLN